MGKVTKLALILLPLILGLAFLAARPWWPRSQAPSPDSENHDGDPRLWYKSQFRNVRPDVKYVGTAACAKCHADYAESFARHPMGRSLAPIAAVAAEQNYAKEAGNPFEAGGFQFLTKRRGEQVVHHEIRRGADGQIVTETAMEIDYAIGSGTHACSYLIERDGLLFESPITWFAQKNAWDLSPGFKDRRDRFERLVMPECLFCHCNQAEPVADTLNRYQTPIFHGHTIGCERCHGPGELHVRDREGNKPIPDVDTSIVNPRHLSSELSEAVCAQCHLSGFTRVPRRGRDVFDFRPGLPFELFWTVFVKPDRNVEEVRVADHVEQVHASQCFRASNGKLGCTSCHDPHMLPRTEEKETYYRTRCLNCHETKGCSVPAEVRRATSATDSCTACHMPSVNSDLDHIALTDHRIPRTPGNPAAVPHKSSHDAPLVPFYGDTIVANDADIARDLGVALMNSARQRPDASRMQVAGLALPWLEAAVRAHPDDLDARDALGVAFGLQNRPEEALGTYRGTLQLAPHREIALTDAALMARGLGQHDASLRYWQAALEINPWSSRYRYEAARLLATRGEWDKVLPECRRVLKYNAAHVQTRMLLVEYYLHKDDKEQARAEFKTVRALKPPNIEQLEKWFSSHAGP